MLVTSFRLVEGIRGVAVRVAGDEVEREGLHLLASSVDGRDGVHASLIGSIRLIE